MAAFSFFMPPVNLMGEGCLDTIGTEITQRGLSKALIVTDKPMVELGIAKQVTDILEASNIEFAIFDEVVPNPTDKNVEAGVALLQEVNADFVISLGGGSPHDCAKGIALVATNGGRINDFEGVNKSEHPQLPLIAINTTSGTASEITRFCIITDTDRHIKMAIVDWHTTPIISVNDANLMKLMPPGLTAATGMDALTHAVEAYVSTIATPVTDACAIKAIEIIAANLKNAVDNGEDMVARDNMTYAQLLAGMAFNNASLGYVHAMAHQLGGFYDLAHGVCNAILLPHVSEYNAKVVPERFADIAVALGVNIEGLSTEEAAAAAIVAIKELSASINIPAGLTELGCKEEDVKTLSENALKDACGLTNPKQASLEEIMEIYLAAF